MGLKKTLAGLRLIGLRNGLRAVRYAQQRDALERQFRAEEIPQPAQTGQTPGRMQRAESEPGGARFHFEHAELEIRFLAPDLLRVSWEPGAPPLLYALAKTDWPVIKLTSRQEPEGYSLTSEAAEVLIREDGSLRFRDSAGRKLREESPPERRGRAWIHRARLRPEEHLYGLGERAAPLNLRGRTYRMWNQDAGGVYTLGDDPLYICIPVYLSLHGEGSYLIFYENSHPAEFDLRGDESIAHFSGGALHYDVIIGSPARVLEGYTELTGRPPLPPLWTLGYHQACVAYRTEADLRALADEFQNRHLPLSAIHLDLDYMDGFRTFTVDEKRFPNLKGIAAELAARGVRLVTIIDTGVKCDPNYRLYREGMAKGVFCALPNGEPARGPVWPGACVFPDFTHPKTRTWWGKYYSDFLEKGIAGFWHDMNEPAVFAASGAPTLPLPTRHALEGRGGDHAEAHNLYALAMNQAGYDALRNLQPDRRPFLLTRSGWAGVQRYAWSWTGDSESSWAGLRQTIVTVLGLGLSGILYTGPDIGGFNGTPSGELYLRWFQMATFLPFFRAMAAFTTPRREPWFFGEPYLSLTRAFLRLRYRLLPYFYTLAWEAGQTGQPLVRPLFWSDSAAQNLWDVDDAFLLGDALLVAPIVEENARAREVSLPPGTWYSFWDDAAFRGPARVRLNAPLERVPILVRAGSILPMDEGDRLSLHLYPPTDGEGQGLLYSDAGEGYGDWLLNRFRMTRREKTLEMTWQREGRYPFPYAYIELCLHGERVQRAWVDGAEVECQNNRLLLESVLMRARFELQ